jgi:hypothetical protein
MSRFAFVLLISSSSFLVSLIIQVKMLLKPGLVGKHNSDATFRGSDYVNKNPRPHQSGEWSLYPFYP